MDNKELAIYKANLLKKYIEDSASKSERRQIEEWAIDDDFLFEAIEGIQSNTPQQNATALKDISDAIHVNKKRYWFMAASIAVLLSVYGLYEMQQSNLDNQMVIVMKKDDDASHKRAIIKDHNFTPTFENTGDNSKSTQPINDISKTEKSPSVNAKTKIKNLPAKNNRLSNTQKQHSERPATIVAPSAQEQIAIVEPKVKPELTDADTEVVDIQTIEDVPLVESDKSMEFLEDEIIQSEKVPIDGNSGVSAKQQATRAKGRDGALDYMKESIKYDSLSTPIIGFTAYEEYIRNNKNTLPFSGYARGNVIVQFRVSPSGQLSQFRILKSMGKKLDEESIRLIRNGCGWTNANEIKEIVTSYSVTFY